MDFLAILDRNEKLILYKYSGVLLFVEHYSLHIPGKKMTKSLIFSVCCFLTCADYTIFIYIHIVLLLCVVLLKWLYGTIQAGYRVLYIVIFQNIVFILIRCLKLCF